MVTCAGVTTQQRVHYNFQEGGKEDGQHEILQRPESGHYHWVNEVGVEWLNLIVGIFLKISRYRHEFGERQALPQQWFSYKLHWSDQRRWEKWRSLIDGTQCISYVITGLSSWLRVPLVWSKRIPLVTNCWQPTSTKTWTVSPRCQTTRGALSLRSHTSVACTCSPQKVNR